MNRDADTGLSTYQIYTIETYRKNTGETTRITILLRNGKVSLLITSPDDFCRKEERVQSAGKNLLRLKGNE